MAKREKIAPESPAAPENVIPLEWREGIMIDKHSLDECLVQQPDLFFKISERLALVLSRRDAAKDELKVVESEADEDIRQEAIDNDEKISEAQVKAKITKHASVLKASKRLSALNYEAGQLQALKEAYLQRSYMLKELVSLFLANYYGDGTGSANSKAARAVKDSQYDDNRRALSKERERRSK